MKLSDIRSLDRFALDGILPFQVRIEAWDRFISEEREPWVGIATGSSLDYVRDEVAHAIRIYQRVRVVAIPSGTILFASTTTRKVA